MKLKQKQYNYPSRTIYELSWDSDGVSNTEIQDWCEKNFGKGGYNEETKITRWVNTISGNSVMFLLEEDMILFKLRWE